MQTIPTTAKYIDVIYLWDLIDVNSEVLNTNITHKEKIIYVNIEINVTTQNIASIEKNIIIRHRTYIIGSVKIEEDCDITLNTVILSSITIKNSVTIDSFTEIKNSTITNNTRIGTSYVLSNSIIGEVL